ncbi:MAG: glutathione S-transferase family protein [Alphaproteobacteria bacterium]|nr:glutathione S-transferase family protein [Alphaproteobacteria bacterium]
MSYELYCLSGSCSMAVHVLLNELGEDVKIHMLERGEKGQKSPEYLKINPHGNVPFLIEDGKGMSEGGAIITYLCDKHKSPLLPQNGWERAKALQWLMFCNATLHPAYARTFWINANLPEEQREEALKVARAQIQKLWDYVEQQLEQGGGPYLTGKAVTAGDILLSVIANWNAAAYKFGPKTRALFQAVSSRPAYQKTLATESVEYKAAA